MFIIHLINVSNHLMLMKNYKPSTPKQLEKRKTKEQKLMKELYESDFHKIIWDKKCV